MSTVLSRWRTRLATRRGLLRRALRRGAGHKLVNERHDQVAKAERVIARHTPQHVTTISPAGVQLIAEFEGCRLDAYRDAVGVLTIGYGHTENVRIGDHLASERAARKLLERDLDRKYAPYVAQLGLPLNQNQFDALTSFVFNVGPGGIAPNTGVGRALRAHDWQAAADHLLEWDHGNGRVLPGLVTRRRAERELFLRPVQ